MAKSWRRDTSPPLVSPLVLSQIPDLFLSSVLLLYTFPVFSSFSYHLLSNSLLSSSLSPCLFFRVLFNTVAIFLFLSPPLQCYLLLRNSLKPIPFSSLFLISSPSFFCLKSFQSFRSGAHVVLISKTDIQMFVDIFEINNNHNFSINHVLPNIKYV